MKVGDWVVYYDGNKPPEVGKIKRFTNDGNAFVVYHCDNNWDDVENYTGASSDLECLTVIYYKEKESAKPNN